MELSMNIILCLCVFVGTYISSGNGHTSSKPDHVICRGTNLGLGTVGTASDHFMLFKRLYTNCTYVDGNLEITYLDGNEDYDLSFLSSIEEISGYVLIYSVFTQKLHLINLRLIRGNQLFSLIPGEKLYSLIVASNSKPNSETNGLMELGFKHLQEIMNGMVYFYNNNLLCYEQTILWADINPSVLPHARYNFNNTYYRRPCEECHPACYNDKTESKQCWGRGPDMCQKLNLQKVCSQNCGDRCFGSALNECCHPECAAGCYGPSKTDCFACKHFFNVGECVSRCPPYQVFNHYTLEIEENPNGKFAYGALCVKDCPAHLIADKEQNICIETCRPNMHDVNGTCVYCNGQCAKTCEGSDYIKPTNLKNFENCTIVNGNLQILEASFQGDAQFKIKGITVAQLDVLKSVIEVTGHIAIQADDTHLRSLSFLSSLEVIHGRELDSTQSALNIIFTPLMSLDLVSLKQIKNGYVTIAFNRHLCYVDGINWFRFFAHKTEQKVRLVRNKNATLCKRDGEVCDSSCSDDGCWNKYPDKCLGCRKFRIDNSSNICINNCSVIPGMYEVGNGRHLCGFCDGECESGCRGAGPDNCVKCKHVSVIGKDLQGKQKIRCLKECPPYFYADVNKVCNKCAPYCDEGCTGPSSIVKYGGCKTCALGIEQFDQDGKKIYNCMDPKEGKCASGYYRFIVSLSNMTDPLAGKTVCKRCNDMCTECIGPDTSNCLTCKYYKQLKHCVHNCSSFYFADSNNMCQVCHEQCRGSCFGPTSEDCEACKYFKVYSDNTEHSKRFNCTGVCPPDKPHEVPDEMNDDVARTVCTDISYPLLVTSRDTEHRFSSDEGSKTITIIGGSIGGFFAFSVIGALLVLLGYLRWNRTRSRGMTMNYEGGQLPLTDAVPDISSLRLIEELQLQRGGNQLYCTTDNTMPLVLENKES